MDSSFFQSETQALGGGETQESFWDRKAAKALKDGGRELGYLLCLGRNCATLLVGYGEASRAGSTYSQCLSVFVSSKPRCKTLILVLDRGLSDI